MVITQSPSGGGVRMRGPAGVTRRVAPLVLAAALLAVPGPAAAYETAGLLIYLDATVPASAPSSGTTWTDLSPAGRHGTLTGPVTYDAVRQAVVFPGGANGTAFVDLAGDYADFSTGFTIEFEAEFGVTRSNWERIFDFALGLDSPASNIHDAFWVGQLAGTNELTIEVWISGAQQGYCHTATGGTALGPLGSREFARWTITIGTDGACRIYRDGVAQATRVSTASPFNPNISPTGATTDGSAFTLPRVTSRPSAFLGRSNFLSDADLEGAIRYIRIYDRELTPTQAATNASRTVTFDANDDSGRTTTQSSAMPATLTLAPFARAGHTFLGWATEADGSGDGYADGASFAFAADVTLYARWQADAPPPAPASGPVLRCDPVPAVPGARVTCTLEGAEPDIDFLWRVDGDGGPTGTVRTDARGDASFQFTTPLPAAGEDVVVRLLGWGLEVTIAGPSVGPAVLRPTTVSAGEGPGSELRSARTTALLLATGAAGLTAFGLALRQRRMVAGLGRSRPLPRVPRRTSGPNRVRP
jgi:hypothetical protein